MLDNLQQDAECSLQFLDIIQKIMFKSNPDELDKSTLMMACAMLRVHFLALSNTVLKLKQCPKR